jgi:hypothetical protein
MASLDTLPADQRAVLQLVLQRGRSYDDIARLLSIDRTAVRQRALTALDALGPQTGVPEEQRALITDYLLGQLSGDAQDDAWARLGQSPSERAWARVIASELASLSNGPLPEIPTDTSDAPRGPVHHDDAWAEKPSPGEGWGEAPAGDEPMVVPDVWPEPAPADPSAPPLLAPAAPPRESTPVAPPSPPPRAGGGDVPPEKPRRPGRDSGGRSSRRGGLILIGLVVLVVIAVAVILIASGGSGGGSHSSSSASASQTSSTAASTTSSTSSTAAKVVAQINLTPPTPGSKAAGIAEVLKEGAKNGIAIVAQNVPPNTTKPPNAYAVWLYNSAGDAHLLGFVNPGVGSNGRLSTAGGLPANASHFKQLIVTVESQASPKAPGTIILQGTLTGV